MGTEKTCAGHWTGLLCAALLMVALPAAAQTVPGFTVTTYAQPVVGPVFLAFAPDGTLYAGRDTSPPTGSIAPAFLTRIGPGGAPIEDYGNVTTPDPDPAVFDVLGLVSGVAGSVLTGGNRTGPSSGSISASRPDQTVVELWTSTQWDGRPLGLKDIAMIAGPDADKALDKRFKAAEAASA